MVFKDAFEFADDVIDRIRHRRYQDYDVETNNGQSIKVHFDLRYNFVEFHLPDGSSCAEYYGNWERDEKEIKRTAGYAHVHTDALPIGA